MSGDGLPNDRFRPCAQAQGLCNSPFHLTIDKSSGFVIINRVNEYELANLEITTNNGLNSPTWRFMVRAGSTWLLVLVVLVIVGLLTITVYAMANRSQPSKLPETQRIRLSEQPNPTLDEVTKVREFIKQKNRNLTDAEVNRLAVAFINSSRANGVDLWLLLSVAASESHFRANVISRAGCIGIMQIKPTTAYSVGIDPDSLYKPEQNIEAGTRYLRRLLDMYEDESLAIAAYNAGPSRVKTSVPAIRETRQYVQKVSAKREELVRMFGPATIAKND